MAAQGQSLQRLREYLRQLPPRVQAMLLREFEQAIARGDDIAVATFVLGELRKLLRETGDADLSRTENAARLLFRAIEPFLVDRDGGASCPGQIRRSSLLPIWTWLGRDLLAEPTAKFEHELGQLAAETQKPAVEALVRRYQLKAAEAILAVMATRGSDQQRLLHRVGSPTAVEDLVPLAAAFKHREALEALLARLPNYVRNLADEQFHMVRNALDIPSLQLPQVLPLALTLTMRRLATPWQIIRLATIAAASDEAIRIASTPYAVAVTLAINDATNAVAELRADLKRGRYGNVSNHLKLLYDAMRGLRSELDVRSDSGWGRQLATLRTEISNLLKSEIEMVPGRVRRLLRQRSDKDIAAGSTLDATEIAETAALIDFVGVCRTYASELAINEVTLRAYSDLQQYLEQATQALVDALRTDTTRHPDFRQSQADVAIRFCSIMFGDEYASLMTKAAGMALGGERKPARAG
ncbi:MAG: hypothetical protein EPO23_00555 [Xanthobacteraceae bacterium]|nr:MAG: hypothetical protein EPO23_00555 [Xanthobacteraceae bacterium]